MNFSIAANNMATPRLEELVITIRAPSTPSPAFRFALAEIGRFLGYEISKQLTSTPTRIKTSLGKEAIHYPLEQNPVLITILRAGIPLYQGLQDAFPNAESGFIGSMRDETTLQPKTTYLALPNLEGKTAIICDTMLATGGSICDAVCTVQDRGAREIYVCSAIAAAPGVRKVEGLVPRDHIYFAALDDELNDKGYIVPGLGDAGDRSFGKKID
ncbi:uracil phosphoribosyltransferase [Candidatus Woesearchaeota archaeon]|nr:MAG: uracil phosphoribosyltransferase [Candidatus Woesearchaeota archaeon]